MSDSLYYLRLFKPAMSLMPEVTKPTAAVTI